MKLTDAEKSQMFGGRIQGDTVTITCDRGHEQTFTMAPDRSEGQFAGPDHEVVRRVPTDSYAYRNGGCCYRAAVESLNGERVFHGLD